MFSIFVNGLSREVSSAEVGVVLIDYLTHHGYTVPRFCYHSDLCVAGNCRMCMVEDENSIKPAVICCALSLTANLSVYTDTVRVKRAREAVLEFLLINHPLDCPICDQAGECDLQDLTLVYGSDHGRFYDYKRSIAEKWLGPIVKTVMNRCILCTRCIRFADSFADYPFLGMAGRGDRTEVSLYVERALASDFSGSLIDICPVGALTSKPHAGSYRSWELSPFLVLNTLDDELQSIRADYKDGVALRILPATTAEDGSQWITDRARYSYQFLLNERASSPLLKLSSSLQNISWKISALILNKQLSEISKIKAAHFLALLGPNYNCEDLGNFALLFPNFGVTIRAPLSSASFLRSSPHSIPSGSNFLVINTDLCWQVPLFALSIRRVWGDSLFFLWGCTPYFNPTNSVSIGCSLFPLKGLLTGRHWLARELQSATLSLLHSVNTRCSSDLLLKMLSAFLVPLFPVSSSLAHSSAGLRNIEVLGFLGQRFSFTERFSPSRQSLLLGIAEGSFSPAGAFDGTSTPSPTRGTCSTLTTLSTPVVGGGIQLPAVSSMPWGNSIGSFYNTDFQVMTDGVAVINKVQMDTGPIVRLLSFVGGVQHCSLANRALLSMSKNFELLRCQLSTDLVRNFGTLKLRAVGTFRSSSWRSYYSQHRFARSSPVLQGHPLLEKSGRSTYMENF